MMILRKFILAAFISPLLAGCNNKQGDATKNDFKPDFKIQPVSVSTSIHPTSYIDNWNYNFLFIVVS
jgi:hypothetical protein